MFGLFKSAARRAEDAISLHLNSLRAIDDDGLALLCAYLISFRDQQIARVLSNGLAAARLWDSLFYHPLQVGNADIQSAINEVEVRLIEILKTRRKLQSDAFAESYISLVGASISTWRNTWLGCLHGHLRHQCQQMWAITARGFPRIGTVVGKLLEEAAWPLPNEDLYSFNSILEAWSAGRELIAIPEGFRPPR